MSVDTSKNGSAPPPIDPQLLLAQLIAAQQRGTPSAEGPGQPPPGKPQKPPPERETDAGPGIGTNLAAAALLAAVGLPAWVAGAVYTVRGATLALNWIAGWLGYSGQLPDLAGQELTLAAVIIGLVFSAIETKGRPFGRRGTRWVFARPRAWAAWLVAIGLDVGSTFMGVQSVGPDAWALTQAIAASAVLSAAWAVALTFGPELALGAAWKMITRRD